MQERVDSALSLSALFSTVVPYLLTGPIYSHKMVPSNCWAIDFLEHAKQEGGKGNLLLRFSGKFLKV